jgi:branched-chain amino acid transport system ATP-binding protein
MVEILRTERLSVRYGGVQALVDADIQLEAGRLTGLIGPNGAGKTTLIDAVTGFAACTGRVVLSGHDVSQLSPDQRSRMGLARTWQAADLFDDLSVRENLIVATPSRSWRATAREVLTGRAANNDAAERLLGEVGLDSVADLSADQLTQGQRKLVGVARALASKPHVVCLDEPAAGLDTHESRRLGSELRSLADRGLAMLLVDHDMGLVFSICDEVIVLDFGKVIARGTPEEVRRHHAVIVAYLGKAAGEVEEHITSEVNQ